MKRIFIIFFIVISSCSIDTSYDPETYDYEEVEKEILLTNISFSLIETKEDSFKSIKIIQKDYLIENPSTGSQWDVSVYSHKKISEDAPAVILVPGGIGSKKDLLNHYGTADKEISIVEKMVSEGFIVLIFSAEGRGESEGEIDYNGYDDQDGLYNLYRFLVSYENVDEEKIGIVSYSYGVAMVSGMLGKFQPEILYYIEWEGPVNRDYVSTGCTGGVVKEGITCDSEDYWVEREALRFVPYFKIDHLMIVQTEKDHVQDINQHSLDFNNLAIKYLPWVRVNGVDNSINTEYNLENLPVLSEKEEYQETILEAMKEFTE